MNFIFEFWRQLYIVFFLTIQCIIYIYYYNSNLIRSDGSRQVDRHGSPDQTRRGASRLILWSAPANETWSGISDQVTVIMIDLLYTLHTSWKYFEINCSMFIYWRKAHFKNNYRYYFFNVYYNPWARSSVRIIKMHQKDTFMLRSRICRLYFEKDKLHGTYFVRCDMNNVTIPHVFVMRKTVY